MGEASETARAIVASCIEYGVRDFVLCPGSRSAPLAYALYDAEMAGLVRLYVETDERVAGFVALGCGKAGKTAALVTTSGSAVANLHPAVEEAFYSAVPMIVLSADRPHELRGVRSSQTSDHVGVLRASVCASVDIPTDIGSIVALRGHLRRAIRVAHGVGFAGGPGPVHVNVAFREPLLRQERWDTDALVRRFGVLSPAADSGESGAQSRADELKETKKEVKRRAKHTVVIAGSGDRLPELRRYHRDVQRFLSSDFAAQFAHVPVLAEPATLMRALPSAIGAHPIVLDKQLPLRRRIERAIVIGHPTLTREVNALLSDPAVEVIVVDEPPTYTDVSGNASQVIAARELGMWLAVDSDWFSLWSHAACQAEHCITQWETSADTLDFQRLARIVNRDAERVPTLLAASSIIREVNLYAPAPGPVYESNRGLAGIDGTVSTAIGMSLARGRAMRVVLGDLAFIHDVGALIATAGQMRGNVQIVLADDGGGSLFSTLEYGQGDACAFDRVFRTEKVLNVAQFAASLGESVRYRTVDGSARACAQALENYSEGIEIVYVGLQRESLPVMRKHRAYLRTRVRDAVASSCL
ncbi:MAG: 2-succinyl-5-enolpyruvyl-6-hydroxy-3-cyclohexene-1-carboxylic-acid synthase [Actinomycetaceae bacterium]|nr:2-succinyl-5-enolpyruvyl-6-hydroxy-3-cyclohexene-1-carboxylic-acid synthase [Arcanobacterium sp.]MDD7686805.1 2-succinyl-5-enolpyruvyl-6-hydroxy-3-cyclohexene-1-carboxylic-acid synthase [Actinomycetaceae bacterium]MDY5273612.1 2-succinyl-5-enolpyruvyl-6-hydroxy-3-cyclohexene-1-carboxylic-acid synthase [Arcanobacterium sp.]